MPQLVSVHRASLIAFVGLFAAEVVLVLPWIVFMALHHLEAGLAGPWMDTLDELMIVVGLGALAAALFMVPTGVTAALSGVMIMVRWICFPAERHHAPGWATPLWVRQEYGGRTATNAPTVRMRPVAIRGAATA